METEGKHRVLLTAQPLSFSPLLMWLWPADTRRSHLYNDLGWVQCYGHHILHWMHVRAWTVESRA